MKSVQTKSEGHVGCMEHKCDLVDTPAEWVQRHWFASSSSRDHWMGLTNRLEGRMDPEFSGVSLGAWRRESICFYVFGPWQVGDGELESGEEKGMPLTYQDEVVCTHLRIQFCEDVGSAKLFQSCRDERKGVKEIIGHEKEA